MNIGIVIWIRSRYLMLFDVKWFWIRQHGYYRNRNSRKTDSRQFCQPEQIFVLFLIHPDFPCNFHLLKLYIYSWISSIKPLGSWWMYLLMDKIKLDASYRQDNRRYESPKTIRLTDWTADILYQISFCQFMVTLIVQINWGFCDFNFYESY